jgi:hypothetical protein
MKSGQRVHVSVDLGVLIPLIASMTEDFPVDCSPSGSISEYVANMFCLECNHSSTYRGPRSLAEISSISAGPSPADGIEMRSHPSCAFRADQPRLPLHGAAGGAL